MSSKRPLAYIYKKREKWVLIWVKDLRYKFETDTYDEARQLGIGFGWQVKRYKPWDIT